MAEVTLNNVRKVYVGGVEAVKGVSFDVPDGHFCVMVGPSGCGKTTTLNLVAGLIPITSGDIVIGDRVVNDLDPKDRDIAMVFQNYALYPHMRVYDNMAYGLRIRGLPSAQIDERVQRAGRSRPPTTFSNAARTRGFPAPSCADRARSSGRPSRCRDPSGPSG